VGSVYGYPGPLAWNCSESDPFLEQAFQAIADAWHSQSAITAFTRFHPMLENQRWVNASRLPSMTVDPNAPSGLVFRGQTVSVDLTKTEAENIRDYQKVLRQEINHGRKMGVVTEVDQHWDHLDDFLNLYHLTMGNNHASAKYFFPRQYFLQLRKALGSKISLLLTRYEGKVVSAGLFIEHNGSMHAHLAGRDEQYRSISPFKVMLDDARRWARERGNTLLHLGGGRGGKDDSLFAFKARYSPRRHQFYIGQWVVNRGVYDCLCKERQAYAAKAGLTFLNPEFFPAYRAPLGEVPELQTAAASSVSVSRGKGAMAE
jgi:hypothetical protein